jgi:hypothetical protein
MTLEAGDSSVLIIEASVHDGSLNEDEIDHGSDGVAGLSPGLAMDDDDSALISDTKLLWNDSNRG